MATLKEANKARDQFSQLLEKRGAHAIGVDKVNHNGKETFGVIAFYESAPEEELETLEIEGESGKKTVPVQTIISPLATLE